MPIFKKRGLTAVCLLISISALCVAVYSVFKQSENEIFVVDNNQLFNKFNMTIEAKKAGQSILGKINFRIDSLELAYNTVTDLSVKKRLETEIMQARENAANFDQRFSGDETAKIWSRLNDYIKEFKAAKKYPLIVSSGTNGMMVFPDPGKDITNELIHYVNQRYEGIK